MRRRSSGLWSSSSDFDRSFRRTDRLIKGGFILIALVIVLAILSAPAYVLVYRASAKDVTITVEDKGSVTQSSGSGDNLEVHTQYRVYTDKGVYVVEDSWAFLNFRAADRYGALKVGKTYDCTQAGWRVGLMSWFPNLISCKEAT